MKLEVEDVKLKGDYKPDKQKTQVTVPTVGENYGYGPLGRIPIAAHKAMRQVVTGIRRPTDRRGIGRMIR